MKTKASSKIYMAIVFLILYIPILVLIVFSFNTTANTGVMSGFSFYWYKELFNSPDTFNALKNTLILATCASVISTVISTAAAVGINKMKSRHFKSTLMSVTNIPMMNPEIVTGISMMLLFVFVGTLIGLEEKLGFVTLLISHITFCLPYCLLSIMPRVKQLDKSVSEAAYDLGCTPGKAFFKVELPNIMPGIISGLIMSFSLSLDDFVISYFTSGSDFQTLPLLIYSMTKKEVKPDIYALSALMIAVVTILLILSNIPATREERINRKKASQKKALMLRENHKLKNRKEEGIS